MRFVWIDVHEKVMKLSKESSLSTSILIPLRYGNSWPIIFIVDSKPHASGWAIGQDDEDDNRSATRFGAKIFTKRNRPYHK